VPARVLIIEEIETGVKRILGTDEGWPPVVLIQKPNHPTPAPRTYDSEAVVGGEKPDRFRRK
jgi:hypothetical protein